MLQLLRSGSISHLTERPPSHTPLRKMAAISRYLCRELNSEELCPFHASFLLWSRDCHGQCQLPPPLFWRESENVSPDKMAITLWCSEVGGATAPQRSSHLVGGHGFTLPPQHRGHKELCVPQVKHVGDMRKPRKLLPQGGLKVW